MEDNKKMRARNLVLVGLLLASTAAFAATQGGVINTQGGDLTLAPEGRNVFVNTADLRVLDGIAGVYLTSTHANGGTWLLQSTYGAADGTSTLQVKHGSNIYASFAESGSLTLRPPGDVTLKPASGKVGVGTSSPWQALHVVGNIVQEDGEGRQLALQNDNGIIFRPDREGNALGRINYRGYAFTDREYRDLAIYNGRGGLVLFVDGSEGSVGVGTSSPSAKLDVAGAVNAQQLCIKGDCKGDWGSAGAAGAASAPTLTCETRETVIDSFTWSTGAMAKCLDDEVMTGGGCYINNRAGGSWVSNSPDRNGYYCLPAQNKEGSQLRAYARCCKLEG